MSSENSITKQPSDYVAMIGGRGVGFSHTYIINLDCKCSTPSQSGALLCSLKKTTRPTAFL